MEPGISHSPKSLQIPPSDESGELLDLSPEERLFHEINLLRIEGYCFSFDPKSAAKRAGKQEFIELVKMPEGAVSRPITIEPHPTYGYPATIAYKILQAALKKLSDEGYEGADSASFTQRELAKLVGRQTFGGADSKQFLRAVMQLNATRIWCSFFDKETGEWKVLTFTLFTEALFSGHKLQLRECVLTLHPRIIASLKNRHYFCLNYNLQISEFPTGDFGSNRQAVSVETDRPFRSKAAPRCGWVLVPALANRRCVIHPILLWSAKASTLVIIIVFSDCCGRL
jgi:hypothetical protein